MSSKMTVGSLSVGGWGRMAMLALCSLFGGCLYEPFDGQVVSQDETIQFAGYGADPGTWISLDVAIPEAGGTRWQTVRWAKTAEQPTQLFDVAPPQNHFFAYSGTFTVPFAAWHVTTASDGRTVLGARVRAFDTRRKESYLTVRSDRYDCYVAHTNKSTDYLNACGSKPGSSLLLEMR